MPAHYTYLANSPLVEQIAFKQNGATRMNTFKDYDLLNRLVYISSYDANAVALAFHSYQVNAANQRTRRADLDNSHWEYGYDALGQVVSGKRYWGTNDPVAGQQFEYAFDDIGNRKTAKSGGNQFGRSLRATSYSSNS